MLEKAVFRGFCACLKSVLFACVSCMMFVLGGISFAHADETYPFSITTTTLPSNDKTFTFTLSPRGTFYVDCGDGGTLTMTDSVNPVDGGTNVSGPDANGVYTITIVRTYNADDEADLEIVDNFTYACTYSNTSPKTIRFGGKAWDVSTSDPWDQRPYARNGGGVAPEGIDGPIVPIVPTISFKDSCSRVASIEGDLAPIFPFYRGRSSAYPQFYETFMGCTHLTNIPNGLFGYTADGRGSTVSGDYYMFAGTFKNCTGLTELPPSLFSTIGSAIKLYPNGMFRETFYGCSNLSGFIPPDFFSLDMVIEGYDNMPSSIFGPNRTPKNLMTDVFYDDDNLDTQCPADYYQFITGYEDYWDGHVSCKPCPPDTHSPVGSTSIDQCVSGYSVTYNCGVVSGAKWVYEVKYDEGANVELLESPGDNCSPTEQQAFTEWSCTYDGNTITPDENNTFSMPAAHVTCTAQWGCNNANNYWWNADNTECVQGHKITLNMITNCLEPQYPIEPTVLYTIPTRGAYLDEERTLLMSKTENPIQLPYVEFIANFDTNAPLNPYNNDIQYSVPEVASVNLNNYRYHCPFTMSPSSYGYTFNNCFIHNHPDDYLTLSDTYHISGLTPKNRNGYLTDEGIYEAEHQNEDQTWWIKGCSYSSMPTIISPSLTGYTFDNWCTDVTGTTGCFKGQVPNTIAENTTYYAHWTPKHYTVTYNKGAHATENSENYVDAYICEVDENTEECFGGATFDAPYTALSFNEAPISGHMLAAEGYVFAGWTTDSTPTFDDNGDLNNEFTGYEYWKTDDNLTVYAAYVCDSTNGYRLINGVCANEYSITYSEDVPDGVIVNGMPDPLIVEVAAGTENYQLAPLPTATGYTFYSWACKDTANNTVTVSATNTITMPATGVVCNAMWNCDSTNGYRLVNGVCVNEYSITYSEDIPDGVTVNGMPDPLTEEVPAGTEDYQLADLPTATGYDITGWSCKDTNNNTVTVSSNNTITMPSTGITCSLVWNCDTTHGYYLENGVCVNDYGITYTSSIPAGVTVSGMPDPLTVEVPAGTEYTLAQLPTATGYNITGWNCGSNVTVSANNTITMPSTGITCSLVWGCDTTHGYRLVNGVCVNDYGITYTSSIPAGVTVSGMPDPLTVEVPAGTENYELAPLPTATGYNITGWDCGNNVTVSANNTITMPSTGIACSLVWNCDTTHGYYLENGVCVNDYGITYTSSIPAGVTVSGMPDPLTVEVPAGTENYELAPLPTATGYNITGWNCGSNVTVSANNTITMPSTGITCSLVWGCDTANGYHLVNGVCDNTYAVIYSCGESSGVAPTTNTYAIYGEQFTSANNTCDVPNGAVFAGWGVSGTDDVVSGGFTWNYTEDKIFTAVWGCDSGRGYQWNATHDACVFVCDTGKWLHIGEERMCLYDYKVSSPALAVQIQEETYYLRMESGDEGLKINDHSNKKFKIEREGILYNVSDISTL